MDKLLTSKMKKQLSHWIGRDRQFKLLYKLTRDGGSAETYRLRCAYDWQTVIIFYNADGNVYGGYLSKNLGNTQNWRKDPLAFLFKLYTAGNWKPMKFPYIDGENNIVADSYGPWFYSLPSFQTSIRMDENNVYNLSTSNFFDGQRFDMKGETAQSVANGHNNVTDLEVYHATEFSPDEELQSPWRGSKGWNLQVLQELKEFIVEYKPLEEMKIPEVNILLIGQVGAGKSSFFNTINSIFKGEISSRACTGGAENSLTQKLEKLRIRDPSTKKYLRFWICDTCGIPEGEAIQNEDIGFILDGHLPNRNTRIETETSGPVKEPTVKEKIHVVVFILDGSNLNFLSKDMIKKLKEIKSLAVDRGVPHLVFLTKIDEICELVSDDVSKVYKSKTIKNAVDKARDLFAIPTFHVFPIKNYEKESELQTSMNILALMALQKSLMVANEFLENHYELKQDKMEIE